MVRYWIQSAYDGAYVADCLTRFTRCHLCAALFESKDRAVRTAQTWLFCGDMIVRSNNRSQEDVRLFA